MKKLSSLLFSSLLLATLLTSNAMALTLSCPPASAIHCDAESDCTLDSKYTPYFSLAEYGLPRQSDIHWNSAETIGHANQQIYCRYASSEWNLVELFTKMPVTPDLGSNTSWRLVQVYYACWDASSPALCPFHSI